jgi:transposase-like protein
MAEKERVVRRLLSQGLTVTQISAQTRCSPHFIRRVRATASAPVEAVA